MLSPWYFDSQTKEFYTAGGYDGQETLTFIRQKQLEQGCVLMEKTKCSDYPPRTEKEVELGTDGITWTCTDELNGGSVCTKSCAAGHYVSDHYLESLKNFRVR